MAHIMRLLADAELVVAPLERDGACVRADQAGDEAQQRALAGTIGPGQQQWICPTATLKLIPCKDAPAAPDAARGRSP